MKNSTTLSFLLSIFLVLALILTTSAQLQNTNWYFGNQTGLNFNDGTLPPTILNNGVMSTQGGTAVVSDEEGNLLFYTNSVNVWNKNHQIMKDGAGLYGSTTVSQSVVVIQKPFDAIKYYIITNQGQEVGSHGLSYSYLVMSAENNLGNVDVGQKNVQLLPYASEKLTAVFNPNDDSYWVISFGPSTDPNVSDTFYTFKVDENGINLAYQSTFAFPFEPNTDYTGGQMKISPDGTSLALAHNTISRDDRYGILNYTSLFRFEFDMYSGEVYSMNSQFICNDVSVYGIEFSPDSSLLYVTSTHTLNNNVYPLLESEFGTLYQINYRNQTQSNFGNILYEGLDPIYGLQLGIDGKIYAVNSSGNLGVINNPNVEGFGANYQHERIDLSGLAEKDLPQLMPYNTGSIIFEQKVYSVLSNPFDESLNTEFYITASYELKLYNIYGTMVKFREVEITSINQRISIDAENLSDGVYILTVQTQDFNNEIENTTVIKSDD